MAKSLLLTPDHIRNFWAKVQKGGPDECWLWTGWKNDSGHPRFEIAGDKWLATHISLILHGTPRPAHPNDCALHGDYCISPACVNPTHIRWGSKQDNSDDMARLGRANPRRGELNHKAKLTVSDVLYIRSSTLSQRRVAAELGVTQVLVGKVRNRKVWAHVP